MKQKNLDYKKSMYIELLKLGIELDRQLNYYLNIGNMDGYHNTIELIKVNCEEIKKLGFTK